MSHNIEVDKRRELVAEYYFKGYTTKEIARKVNCSLPQARADIKLIKEWLNRKTVKTLEYRKRRSIAKIELAQKTAWEICADYPRQPNTQLSALRVTKELLELEARVDGVIAEKLTGGADTQVAKLIKELKEIEARASGNGHKEGEKAEVLTNAE